MLDIRMPIGLMFLLLGALLGVYGLMTPAQVYQVSLGINLNLIWGGCMAAFGVAMLVWMRVSPHEPARAEAEATIASEPEASIH